MVDNGWEWLMIKIYPLVNKQLAIENGPVEIVDLPTNSMVVFHSYVNVYQRVIGFDPDLHIAPPPNLHQDASAGLIAHLHQLL